MARQDGDDDADRVARQDGDGYDSAVATTAAATTAVATTAAAVLLTVAALLTACGTSSPTYRAGLAGAPTARPTSAATSPTVLASSPTKLRTTKLRTTKLRTTKLSTTKPAAKKPATTKPATTKPATTKPATTKPATTKLSTTKPATTKPATTKPETTKPETTKPETTKPETTKPATTKPTTGKSPGRPWSGRPPKVKIKSPTTIRSRSPKPSTLPLGGTRIFPRFRVVADYGAPGNAGLGVLGAGTPEQAAVAIEKRAAAYEGYGRPVQPTMELLATVDQGSAGADGDYSKAVRPQAVADYLAVTKRHHLLLVLDFQPGRGEFLPQVKQFRRFLDDPWVGAGLDPEWMFGPGRVPGTLIGSASAASATAVSSYLAGIVRTEHLPQKLFVVHQFTPSMLPDRAHHAVHPELATVLHADGHANREVKPAVYPPASTAGEPDHGQSGNVSGVDSVLVIDLDEGSASSLQEIADLSPEGATPWHERSEST